MAEEGKNIKDVLGDLFTNNRSLSKSYNQYSVEQVWRNSMGELISQYTTSVRFSKGIITVYISSASLKQELVMHKSQLLDRLNQLLPYNKATDIIIR